MFRITTNFDRKLAYDWFLVSLGDLLIIKVIILAQ
jgi:hypothetical protein